jgi:hypothetical protein
MNRPRRPTHPPPRRKPGGPPQTHNPNSGPPRRRSALDVLPVVDPPFKVLGTGVDRQVLLASGEPLELMVAQGYTRNIEEAFQKLKRPSGEEFWIKHPELIESARKLDEVLAKIQARKGGS